MTATPTYYIYRHIRPDTGSVFYIGLGKEGSKRAWSNSGRNKHWKNVVAKNEGKFTFEYLHRGLTKEEAIQKEIELIAQYGRCGDGVGTLVNVLKGGQIQDIGPNAFRTWSDDVKSRMSAGHIGNKSNIGKVVINNGIKETFIYKDSVVPEDWKLGRVGGWKLSAEIKKRYSENRKGKPMSAACSAKRNTFKVGNTACGGMIWVTNGIESALVRPEHIMTEGWRRGRHHITNPTGTNRFKKLNKINL